jgi:hypothetical protein
VVSFIVVAMALAELNNTVHLCSNRVCTVDFILKLVHLFLLSACVLKKVVVAKAELNNSVHPLHTCKAGAAGTVLHGTTVHSLAPAWHKLFLPQPLHLLEEEHEQHELRYEDHGQTLFGPW